MVNDTAGLKELIRENSAGKARLNLKRSPGRTVIDAYTEGKPSEEEFQRIRISIRRKTICVIHPVRLLLLSVVQLFFAVLSWQDLIKGFKGCSKFTLTIIADSLCNFRYSHIGFF